MVSVSLGDDCLFRVGETTRDGRTVSFRLKSGDVVVLGGEGRLCFHGVDRIYPVDLGAAEERRPDQPDAAAGDLSWLEPYRRLSLCLST